jgi:aryl-alcohol dehydrogenase-like predicted oxidoreductase
MNRRRVVGGLIAGSAVLAGGAFVNSAVTRNMSAWIPDARETSGDGLSGRSMKYRPFGKSGLMISEVSFGAWGIGGAAYGTADRTESLNALARAEELGCNFVDTAMKYGESEVVLRDFLRGRRSAWLISTKYSGQDAGLETTLEQQLRRLGTDAVDFYMIHWAPSEAEHDLYEALYRVKKAGKARLIGVSLYSIEDIRHVLTQTDIDGLMVAFSLLDPDPFLARIDTIRSHGVGVLARSTLKEGFLTGKYKRDAAFPDPNDQRHSWSRERIAATVDAAERFRFIEEDAGSMTVGAACYPLSYSEVTSVVLGTRSVRHADINFGVVPRTRLGPVTLARIQAQQKEMKLFHRKDRIVDSARRLLD